MVAILTKSSGTLDRRDSCQFIIMVRLILCLIVVFTFCHTSHAQGRGQWDRMVVADTIKGSKGGFVPGDFAFLNADTGIVLATADLGAIALGYVTTDGGKTFQRFTGQDWRIVKINYRNLFVINGSFVNDNGEKESFSRDGIQWSPHVLSNIGAAGHYVNFEYPLSLDSNLVFDVGPFAVTQSDTTTPFLSPDTNQSIIQFAPYLPRLIEDGIADDISHIIVCVDGPNSVSYIMRLTDTGWVPVYPVDTSAWHAPVILEPIIRGAEKDHFFVLGGRVDTTNHLYGRKDDYYETWNGGVSWQQVNSVASGRVVRLANPEPGFLVATVARSPYYRLKDITNAKPPTIDSIFISTDGGTTWAKDGDSFAGDTIIDMFWISSKVGYVMSYNSGMLYLSRYNPLSAVADHSAIIEAKAGFNIFPNPCTTSFSFTNSVTNAISLSICNQLGETVYSESQPFITNKVYAVSLPTNLSPGCYCLIIRGTMGVATNLFLKF